MIKIGNLDLTKYSPIAAGDAVMKAMTVVTADEVKGAHDAQFVVTGGKAYVVYEANDIREGEWVGWDFVYCAMSVVDTASGKVEKIVRFARSGQAFRNETLQPGAAFVPRIVKKADDTLRVFFTSEAPGVRQSLMYYIDYDLTRGEFSDSVYRMKLETPDGKVDFTPKAYYDLAVAAGIECIETDNSAFLFNLTEIDGKTYVALNNYIGKQNALGVLNDTLDCVRVIGHFGAGNSEIQLSESEIIRRADGVWMAIIRNDLEPKNYYFSYSKDGVNWSAPRNESFVTGGTNSKPTLNDFGGVYFMGWNQGTRSAFNLDYSTDGTNWSRLYEFRSKTSFQYPQFYLYDDEIYFTVSDRVKIYFGKLPVKRVDGEFYIDDSFAAKAE